MSELCYRCRKRLEDRAADALYDGKRARRVQHAGASILTALGAGPKTLGELAKGVYGLDRSDTRKRVSANLRQYRDFVMPLGSGYWQLARHAARSEAAE